MTALLLLAAWVGQFLIGAGHRVPEQIAHNAGVHAHALALSLHLLGSGVAMITALLALANDIRPYPRALHRAIGWTYCAAVIVGVAGGIGILPLAAKGGLAGQLGAAWGFILWIYTTWKFWSYARAAKISRHRAWAYRSAAVSFAVLTQRSLVKLLLCWNWSPASSYTLAIWMCFPIHLVLFELLSRLPRERPAEAGESG